MVRKHSTSSSQATSLSKSKAVVDHCAACSKCVTEDDKALVCELCKKWHHSICIGIPDAVMAYFDSDTYSGSGFSLPLICPVCKPSFARLTELSTKIAEMEETFERRLAALEAAKSVPAPLLMGPPPPPMNFTALIKSTLEAETKRHNAVLFGLEEEADDLAAVRRLVTGAGNVAEENLAVKPSIVRVFRDRPEYQDAPRFLKVVCVTSKVQHSFIGLINKVIKRDQPNLRARPDLTWEQRDAGRKLRDHLKQQVSGMSVGKRIPTIRTVAAARKNPRQNYHVIVKC